MKWKNVDIGPGYYYITGTITQWLPLLNRPDIRQMVYDDIAATARVRGASITAFVIMPEHPHLLANLPESGPPHRFNKLWRGRSGRHIPALLEKQGDTHTLEILVAHVNGGCKYAAWKEQVRALAIWSEPKLYAKIDCIHANPVRRNLVAHPGDWEHSSWRFYERGEPVGLGLEPLIL